MSALTGNLQQPFLLLTLESKKVKNTINFVVRYLLHLESAALPARNKCETWNYVSTLQNLPSSAHPQPSAKSIWENFIYFVKLNRQGHNVINLTNRKIRMTFTNPKKSQIVNGEKYIDIKLFRHFSDKTLILTTRSNRFLYFMNTQHSTWSLHFGGGAGSGSRSMSIKQ